MSTPAKHAARLRGGLVGACSALTATVAHTAAGGLAPTSSPLIVLLLLCAALGATVGGFNPQTRWAKTGLLIAGLAAGQLLGHVALAMSGGHHHAASLLTAPMVGLHVAAAVGLGLIIGVAEYLYVVCASVLCWLRIFAATRIRPTVRELWWPSNVVVAQPVLLRAGLGMRAPPAVSGMGF
ncbi:MULTISPECIES: hypothetical protein [unclassified Mycolicibacterium]|uniref:hypothetical protein n=1 Tax=unclassified Mycolicibacterium TaxID=2636767 RepID=UPI0013099B83|nr:MULTISPECIES: hypothetical protein [unclassified Mycolicibacterium]MUL83091.1 hypothetical protein [Mycolicibacterium sp. CBMA 329]MUL89426.1 hypothetical protein [Mycolicibacterium sp. CBMA 331]MUL99115.1 hypothetical protein [Mycolicibacterium sp. CBMA 334]MUM24741.1 hypothetical protein [Mycolicibacterium sp. CBMA 295]MUM38942.1 hypothetical protein [Mycolicibacterium sp. CBMA 247]